MRERLIEYIDGLFSGAALNMRNAEIKEEILQNTLEHYDDLLSEGKSEQEAYDTVIQGIGDVRPLVEPEGSAVSAEAAPESQPSAPETAADETHPGLRGAVGGIWMLFTALYLLISFTTHAWHITWILFLIAPAVISILNAVLDAKSRPGSGRGALASDHGAVLRAQLRHRRVAPDVDPVPDRRSGDGAGLRDL